MPFNAYGFGDVDFESYHRQFAAPFLIKGNEQNNDYFLKEAQQNHIYGVNTALDELIMDAALLASTELKHDAENHLRYGVLRRLRMISTAFRRFQALVPPDRTVPLTLPQSDDVARYLNSIYIDILGLMDNYAWTLAHQLGNSDTLMAAKMQIGLFKRILARDPAIGAVIKEIRSFRDWEKEMKERRNPAAHRMPLYVPSAAFTPEDATTYSRLGGEASAALHEQNYERYKVLQEAQQRVGTFIARFLHDPSGPVHDIYPTVSSDIGNAVLIGRLVQMFLRQPANTGSEQDLFLTTR
ncbi:hypothetical protein [Agrobacterium sp. lyk4-40-TYG-31]|uniref:hypothetical protein n=1 Tax=Agrobacterium sp. lyk4-40-TYG-31 TaxID=3040276 RepID=UPI00254B4C39|nr:hypothetical protein [Agrobacterium sp. lyk4-40-TYG-31]